LGNARAKIIERVDTSKKNRQKLYFFTGLTKIFQPMEATIMLVKGDRILKKQYGR